MVVPEDDATSRSPLASAERVTPDVRALRRGLQAFLAIKDEQGRRIGSAQCGVYAFYDYDGEPIYVGQTYERLSGRIGRHLTNQRTDAVAMRVLDPMEVAEVEVWPFWDLRHGSNLPAAENAATRATLDKAEYTAYLALSKLAQVSKLLNEAVPTETELIDLPHSHRGPIVPDEIRERLAHPDERIARRAGTIASLAQVVKERDVSIGLRETLATQAKRLELLAQRRLEEVTGSTPHEVVIAETTREGPEEEIEAELHESSEDSGAA